VDRGAAVNIPIQWGGNALSDNREKAHRERSTRRLRSEKLPVGLYLNFKRVDSARSLRLTAHPSSKIATVSIRPGFNIVTVHSKPSFALVNRS
jgi:hypothetical protein